MQLDKNLIEGKIDIIERNLDFLKKYKEMNDDDFINSYKDVQAVKYSLFEVIEACIDITSHIISVKGFERAESYAEMFEILGKKEIINSKLAKNLSEMAKFRNILVHGYARVDNFKVLKFIKEELEDIILFVKKILELFNN